jgi:hypothetical protein
LGNILSNPVFWVSLGSIVVVLLVIFAVMKLRIVIKGRRDRAKSVKTGARRAVTAAKRFARAVDGILITPATLAQKGRTAELNAIVVGYFGVLGVRALGYNGTIYGRGDEDEWLQVTGSEERVRFANPGRQTAGDVRVIRDALFAGGLKTVSVEVMAVFTDPKVELALSRKAEALTTKSFKAQLKREKYEKDAGVDIKKAVSAIRAALAEE